MAFGGRVMWEALQPELRKCERCGQYFKKNLEKCSWCGELDETGLIELRNRIDGAHQSNHSIGQWFFVFALVIFLLVVIL